MKMIDLSNETNARRYQLYVDRTTARLEPFMVRLIKPAINRSFIDAARLYRDGVSDVSLVVNDQRQRLIAIFQKQYRRTLNKANKIATDTFSTKRFNNYKRKDAESIFAESVTQFIAQFTAQEVTLISSYTMKQIETTIRVGLNEGLSNKEIASKILKTGNSISPMRAIRIAKTETHTAMSYGIDETINSLGSKFEREWFTAGDERVRNTIKVSHVKADGQKRAQGVPFDVSNEKLMYPGDFNGSAKNIVHCRCVLLYHSI